MTDFPKPETERHLKDFAVREYAERIRQEFTEYLLGEAENRVHVTGTLDTDDLVTGIHELDNAGYRIGEESDDGRAKPGFLFLDIPMYYELRDSLEYSARIPDSRDSFNAYCVTCQPDGSLTAGTGLLIHPDAIVPNSLTDFTRPYIVRDGRGLVIFEVSDD